MFPMLSEPFPSILSRPDVPKSLKTLDQRKLRRVC